MRANSWPIATVSPWPTSSESITPETGATSSWCIFIDSTSASGVPSQVSQRIGAAVVGSPELASGRLPLSSDEVSSPVALQPPASTPPWGAWLAQAMWVAAGLAGGLAAVLFFGSLLPLCVEAGSGVGLPVLYGVGTALPVLGFGLVLAFVGAVASAVGDEAADGRWEVREQLGVAVAGVQVDRLATLAIELVDEGEYRRITHATHLHELDGALLDTLGDIDHHECRIDSGQRAVGILGEIGMSGSIQQVHDAPLVGKLHHRGCHGNAALLFEFHPVGSCVTRGLAPLHGSCELDCTTKKQELLRQRGLACIRMGNDCKGPPRGDFIEKSHSISLL